MSVVCNRTNFTVTKTFEFEPNGSEAEAEAANWCDGNDGSDRDHGANGDWYHGGFVHIHTFPIEH